MQPRIQALLLTLATLVGCAAATPQAHRWDGDEFSDIQVARSTTQRAAGARYYLQRVPILGFSLRVDFRADSWYFLDRAADDTAAQLTTTVIDRQVGYGGAVVEHLLVALDDAFLERACARDTRIKLSGRRGSVVINLPAAWVADFRAFAEAPPPAQASTPQISP